MLAEKHAKIVMDGGAWKLVDLGSSTHLHVRDDLSESTKPNSPTAGFRARQCPVRVSLGFVGAPNSWPKQFAGQERGRVKLNFQETMAFDIHLSIPDNSPAAQAVQNCCLGSYYARRGSCAAPLEAGQAPW